MTKHSKKGQPNKLFKATVPPAKPNAALLAMAGGVAGGAVVTAVIGSRRRQALLAWLSRIAMDALPAIKGINT